MTRVEGVVAALLAGLLTASPVQGQRAPTAGGFPAPRLFVVSPSGARAGETIELTVTGQDMEEPEGLSFGNPAIEAKPIGPAPPPASTTDRRRQLAGVMAAIGPQTSYRFRVTVPPDVAPAFLDVRVLNRWGVSNPRTFIIGDLAETLEHEPNDDVGQAQRVELETTINGNIASPTDVDDFVFAGKEGTHLVVVGLASSIDSRLLLGVQLYDAAGKRLAASHEYRGTDTLFDATLPADGDYLVRVFAFTYAQGGLEYFYRISIATTPWIDAVVPPMVEPGRPAEVTVYGRNLPGGVPDPSSTIDGRVLERASATVTAPDDPQVLSYHGGLAPKSSWLDGFEFRLRNASGVSNPVLIGLAKAPVVLDRGDNDTLATAQPVSLPCSIAGRIEARRDRDWYAFEAKKGDAYRIESIADRIGAPLDLYVNLVDARTGKVLAELDDNDEMMDPVQFFTQTDDPASYRFVAPADGRYALMVSSREAAFQAGPRDQYCVQVTPERPDFRLVVMPSAPGTPDACNILRGGQIDQTVYVWRRDGFEGEVFLGAEGLPEGVTCPPQVVGTGRTQGTLVLAADADMEPWTGTIAIKGTATIGGQAVVREARAATILWPVPTRQKNVPALARLARGQVVAVRGQAPFVLTPGIAEATVGPSETATIPIRLDYPESASKVSVLLTAPDLPSGLSFTPTTLIGNRAEAKVSLKHNGKVAPGVYSIVLRGQSQVTLSRGEQGKQKTTLNVSFPATPVTLTVRPNAR